MPLSKLFNTNRARDKQNELNSIVKGYPLTNIPVVPDILKHQVEFKTIKDRDGYKRLGLTLAHEGSDLVKAKSLEMVRSKLETYRFVDYPEILEHLKSKLPKNVIAISLTELYFEIGDSCQEFKLCHEYKEAPNSFYTYRKLSDCVQCTYYNENGVEFLAGMCFYPAPHGAPMLLKSNDALINIAHGSVIPYPVCDRKKWPIFVMRKKYGRFCASAGKHMMLKIDETDGMPRHTYFDHVTMQWVDTLCKECMEDWFTYKWVEPKKEAPAVVVTTATQEAPATPALVIEKASSSKAPAVSVTEQSTTCEPSTVSHADSTESLFEEFDKIDVKDSDSDDDSDFDAELIY